MQIKEYPSGTQVYDWIIPDEWRVKDAWIKSSKGEKLVDFRQCNIHLVGYSEPVHKKIMFEELKGNLHTHPELENAIPYRTSYYKRDWGFCTTHAQYKALAEECDPLEVYIDSEFNSKGSLTIGELLIQGESDQEVLISTYICHPSLANDNLSGAVMTTFLARELLKHEKPKLSYRIIWVPETIGAIAYCAMNEETMKNISTGLVVTTVGGPGKFGYKESYNTDHPINTVIENIFKKEEIDYINYPFDVHGSDERQYSSQGFRINIASITKDKYYEYPYYHTSLDNLDFVRPEYIVETLYLHIKVLKNLSSIVIICNNNKSSPVYKSNYPNCEVMLSKHNLYPKIGGGQLPKFGTYTELDLILWLLFLCDGKSTIEHISKILKVKKVELEKVALKLEKKELIERRVF